MKKKGLLHFQEREEVRKNERNDIAFRMLYAGESEEKIVKYTKVDAELLRQMIAVKKNLARQKSEAKSRSMIRSLRMQDTAPKVRFR